MRKKDLDLTKAQEMSAAEIGRYLEIREKKFAREYLVDGNATQAAIRAGYKAGRKNSSAAVQGCRLLRDEAVKAYRMALIRENLSDKDLSKESILLKLNEIYAKCMEKEPVLEYNSETKEWEESGTWKFDSRGATKAIEAMVHIMGYDAPQKHEIKATGIDELLTEIEGVREY